MRNTKHNKHINLAAYEKRILERLVIDETSPTGLRWSLDAYCQVRGKPAGHIHHTGYCQVRIKVNDVERSFLAHRLVWFLAHKRWPEKDIDHQNGVKFDNRLSNLRKASNAENMHNRAKQANNTSGVKGVCLDKRSGKWQAKVKINGKNKSVGYFANIADAEKAIRAKRENIHGKFANHGERHVLHGIDAAIEQTKNREGA